MNYAQPRFLYMRQKLANIRRQKGLKQTEMAKKVGMTTGGYAKLERGERQLKIPRLEQIAAALEMELKDFLEVDEKMVFKGPFHDESCQNNYVSPTKEMTQELETSRLLIEQQQREIELLREQVGQLKEIIELMKK
jgi:transcriptional regulator with XRE-family HTH domain